MKSNFFQLGIWITMIMFAACSDDTVTPVNDDKNNGENDPPKVSIIEQVARFWNIDTAYHDGAYDVSSSGKTISFNATGGYDFDGSFQGTYRFNRDSTMLIIDEGTNYQQDWTIEVLTEERFVSKFNSPFTGKPSEWRMSHK